MICDLIESVPGGFPTYSYFSFTIRKVYMKTTLYVGGKTISNLCFADFIDASAEDEQKLEAVVVNLDKTYTGDKKKLSLHLEGDRYERRKTDLWAVV